MQDVMLRQLTQPTLMNVFELSKCIELNMVEEHVVINFEFNKENPRNSSMLME
jgi:hypothetical protein